MNCWKCGARTTDNTCAMCGCLQDSRQPAHTRNGKSLRYIYDKLGPAATLTNPTNFIRCLGDVFADDEEFREKMAQVLQTNVGAHFYTMLSENKEIDEEAQQGLMRIIKNKCSLPDAEIEKMLTLLLEMVGCVQTQRAYKQTPSPIPNLPRTEYSQKAERKQESIERSKKEVEEERPLQNIHSDWSGLQIPQKDEHGPDLIAGIVWSVFCIPILFMLLQNAAVDGLSDFQSIFGCIFAILIFGGLPVLCFLGWREKFEIEHHGNGKMMCKWSSAAQKRYGIAINSKLMATDISSPYHLHLEPGKETEIKLVELRKGFGGLKIVSLNTTTVSPR